MTIWIPNLDGRSGPRYRAIADVLADDIGTGRLAPGARLPTHRDLADALGVTVGTITRAYTEARDRGLVDATVGRGTFVAERSRALPRLIELQPQGLIDLAVNRPAIGPQPEALARTLSAIAQDPGLARLVDYVPPAGLPEHREAGASFVRALGVDCDRERIVVTSGAQSALSAVIAALTEPNDLMVTEGLCYGGIVAAATKSRLRVQGLPLDDEGLSAEAFEALCRAEKPKLLACVPNHHNPTAIVMSEARRRAIVEIARVHDVLVLEDDVYGFLLETQATPLVNLAPERTCYVTCTSKCLIPGLRIGYVAAPPALVERVASAIRTSVWMAPPVLAEVAMRWILDGTAARLTAWQNEEARARRDVAKRVLGRFFPETANARGFHFLLPLPEPWKSGEVVTKLRERGVAITPAEAFVVGRAHAPQAVRVCLTGPRDRDELERALVALADVLGGEPDAALGTI